MKKYVIMAAAAMMVALNLSAQTKRSDDFRAKYQLKEVVVMSRHNTVSYTHLTLPTIYSV